MGGEKSNTITNKPPPAPRSAREVRGGPPSCYIDYVAGAPSCYIDCVAPLHEPQFSHLREIVTFGLGVTSDGLLTAVELARGATLRSQL